MRVAIAISSLRGGGAEKVAAELAGRLSSAGHVVKVFTWEGPQTDVQRIEVPRVVLGHAAPSRSPWRGLLAGRRRVRALRRELAALQPDVVLAFLTRTGVIAALAARPLGIPVVISERSDPRREPLSLRWRLLRAWAYRNAAAVVPNSAEVARWLVRRLGSRRVASVPNPVDVPMRPARESIPVAGPFVLAVGRLEACKGHADLVRAFARCGRGDWTLAIVGEGPERVRLEALIAKLGLRERVLLPGFVRDPWPWFHACEVFALPSYYEGFPNALLEAMAAGKACVSYDCGAGSREIITHGEDGYLVASGDQRDLAARLGELMNDAQARRELGNAARAMRRKYAPDRILTQWERLLRAAASGEPCTSR